MFFARPSHAAVCLRNLLVAMGCAGCAASATTASAKAGGAVAPLVAPPLPEAGATVPSQGPAEVYTTETTVPEAGDPLAAQLAAEIERARKRHGLAPMIRDGRLDRAAHDIALLTAAAEIPAFDATASLLSYYGVVEPNPGMLLKQGDDGAEPGAVADLERELAGNSAFAKWRRFGIGVKRPPGKWMAVLIFHEKNVDLSPVPRRLPSGGSAPVVGRVPPSLHSPEVLVSPPHGSVARLPLATHQGGFSARLECSQGDGMYQVEVVAEDDRGPTVIANFPVSCGIEPAPPLVTRSAPVTQASQPAAVEDQLLLLVNRDRQGHGLAPLVRDERLSHIARRYSEEMSQTGAVAHVSRRSGNVLDRVKAAGVSPMPTTVAENVASALTAADAESGFMASPGHRDNILNPVLTRVGVGVAVGREEGGIRPLFFTQVFAGYGQ
jgi:uncharacterized protein YkwD